MGKYQITTKSGVYEIETSEKPVAGVSPEAPLPGAAYEDIGKAGEIMAGKAVSTFAAGVPEAVLAKEPTTPMEAGLSGAAQSAFLPLLIAKRLGYKIPEPQTPLQRGASVVGTTSGLLAGAPMAAGRGAVTLAGKAIPALARGIQAGKVVPRAIGTGVEAAGATAAIDVPRTISEPKKVAGEVAIAGGLGTGIPVVAGAGGVVGRKILGVSEAAYKTIRKFGEKYVFEPAKRRANYISTDIVPEFKKHLADTVVKGNRKEVVNMMAKLGVTPENAMDITQADPAIVNRYIKPILTNPDERVVEVVLKKAYKNASKNYEQILGSLSDKSYIDTNKIITKLDDLLKDSGVVRAEPNLTLTQKNLINFSDTLKESRGILPAKEYFKYLQKLEKSKSTTDNISNAIAKDTMKAFRAEAQRQIPGLAPANKEYMSVMRLIDNKDSLYKLRNDVNLERAINSLKSEGVKREAIVKIMPQALQNKLEAHLANKEFGLVSEIPGVAKPLPFGLAAARETGKPIARGYYRLKGAIPEAVKRPSTYIPTMQELLDNRFKK